MKPSKFTIDSEALVRVHPLVRADGLFRCAVCHGTKIMQGQSLEHRKPCGNCKGDGYLPLPPHRSISTYQMR
jgi:DnaJ-class molecular chaperone